ncbi:dTDP-4-dehydrorhamnose reductase [Blastopirellula retiformator]|uniref:dTDP-4-dehydrorhamnose reductase n=1 Tax=Blastopirellula retiformator TaxID=2527970 RepID=A0A5C5V7S7_9BACT|nr:dTDP-4-dehydrorhamnose reductase [Blastopirellula retiformator]TWT34576.1 dTDP-4-dehydrorhamnose reductase [Blastopirellula retiformator]
MKSTIAITGADGQLGSELLRQLGGDAVALIQSDMELTDDDAIRRVLSDIRADVLVHCAAYTAVDKAEAEANVCFQVNAAAVATIADVCRQFNTRLVQISTDYVFDSYAGPCVPLTEQTPATPRGIYAQSKLQGEQAAATVSSHLIVRTCGLYGGGPSMRNFVETMLRLAETKSELRVVNDQHCTPSYCRDVAAAILQLVEREATGLFHVTNGESVTWRELASTIFQLTQRSVHVEPITTAEYGAAAPRPAYSVLSLDKFQQTTGSEMPSWRDALQRYLQDRLES